MFHSSLAGKGSEASATPLGNARQFDVDVNFTLSGVSGSGVPLNGKTFGVNVFAAADGSGGVKVRALIYHRA